MRDNIHIQPITPADIPRFAAALDAVARERQYLALTESPPLEKVQEFVSALLADHWPHYIALADNQVIGWCDVSGQQRAVFAHVGSLGMGVIASY